MRHVAVSAPVLEPSALPGRAGGSPRCHIFRGWPVVPRSAAPPIEGPACSTTPFSTPSRRPDPRPVPRVRHQRAVRDRGSLLHDPAQRVRGPAAGVLPQPFRMQQRQPGQANSDPPHQRDVPVSRSASHRWNACFERPSTMSSSRAGPVPSRAGVRSMITVTYLSPRRVLPPGVLIDPDHPHAVEAVRVADQDPAALGQHRGITVSSGTPSQPHRRHHSSGATTRHASTARSGSNR